MPEKKFPVLYHQGKGGAIYSWEVSAKNDIITTEYGRHDGVKTKTAKAVEQKNVGKKNETSLEQQALKEAKAMWDFQVKRKYVEDITKAGELPVFPMLAEDYTAKKKKVKYPVDMQPKLDGVRAMAMWEDGKVILKTRQGLTWTAVPHINEQLAKVLPKDAILDGELYIHGWTFQEITRVVKKNKPESAQVEYHIYDMPESNGDKEKPWVDRCFALIALLPKPNKTTPNIKRVETVIGLETDEQVLAQAAKYVEASYEGGIVRTSNGIYLFGYRSSDLLKVKSFDDAEFKVVDYKSGVGRYENCVVWVCDNGVGGTFAVNHKATIEEKEEFLKNAQKHIGEQLKVKFFGKSEDGNPRFPVGLGFRLPEDTD